MTMPHRNPKRDANEARIVDALRSAGCLVLRSNVFDLIVALGKRVWLMEVKAEKNWKFTPEQILRGNQGWPVAVVHTPEQALKVVGVL